MNSNGNPTNSPGSGVDKRNFLLPLFRGPALLLQALFCLSLLLTLNARADNGTNQPKDLTELPLEALMQMEVPEVLASVPGFYISYDRNYDFLGASGVSLGDANSRILLLVNGHRVNNDLNDSAPIATCL